MRTSKGVRHHERERDLGPRRSRGPSSKDAHHSHSFMRAECTSPNARALVHAEVVERDQSSSAESSAPKSNACATRSQRLLAVIARITDRAARSPLTSAPSTVPFAG